MLYHLGLLPKSALTVEEEAWNAYPYTKTRYTCPFVEKFSLEIETYYFPDDGHQDNVFKLSGNDLRNRVVGTSHNINRHNQFVRIYSKQNVNICKLQLKQTASWLLFDYVVWIEGKQTSL